MGNGHRRGTEPLPSENRRQHFGLDEVGLVGEDLLHQDAMHEVIEYLLRS
jgi:hypothetical protein